MTLSTELPDIRRVDEPDLADLIVELDRRAQQIVPSAGQVLRVKEQLHASSGLHTEDVRPSARRIVYAPAHRSWTNVWRIAAIVVLCVGALGAVQLLGRIDGEPFEQIQAPVGMSPGVPTYLGDSARSGVVSQQGPESNPVEQWSFAFGEGDAILADPVTSEGMVFAGSENGLVVGLQATTGERIWSVETGGAVRATPIVLSDLLIVPVSLRDGTSIVSALDRYTGEERWRADVQGTVFAPLAGIDGYLIVAANDGVVTALDSETGDYLWSAQLGGAILAAPAIADGSVVVASRDQSVSALDLASGEIRWEFVDAAFPLWAAPMVHGGTVYLFNQPVANAGSQQNLEFENLAASLIAIDLQSGTPRWRQDFDWAASSPPAPPIMIGPTLNVFSDQSTVACVRCHHWCSIRNRRSPRVRSYHLSGWVQRALSGRSERDARSHRSGNDGDQVVASGWRNRSRQSGFPGRR